jgi:HptB-dependent secretion and biofilm anti anti-sigma factor
MGKSVTSKIKDNEIVISIKGALNFEVHQQFIDAYTKDGEIRTGKKFTIDLAKTDYCDSSGFGMLLVLREEVNAEKSDISIINASPKIRELLKTAQFHKLFNII